MYSQFSRQGTKQLIHRPAAGACGPFEIDTFEDKMMKFRDACLDKLRAYQVDMEQYYDAVDDEEWIKEWNWDKAKPDKERFEPPPDPEMLKIATKVTYNKNKPCFPPPLSRLSDELVYLATKFINAGVRWKLYPYDFLMSGDINPDRIPTGPAPLVWAYGLPFLPVYKGYYVLTGRQHAAWAGWKIDEKMYKHMALVPVWSIGPVVAPGSLVAQTKQCREEEPNAPEVLDRTVERHARFFSMQSGRQCERGAESIQANRDVVTTCPHWGVVAPRREDGLEFGVMRLCDIPGFSVHIGPHSMEESPPQVLSRDLFQRTNLVAFDYDASFNRPYRCVEEPAMFPLEEETSESESSSEAGPSKRGPSPGPGNRRGKRRRIQDNESDADGDTDESDADGDTDESDADGDADESDAGVIESIEQTTCGEPVDGTSHEMTTPAPSNITCSQDNENHKVECAEHSQNNPAQDDAQIEVQNKVHVENQVEIQDDTQVETQAHVQADTQTDAVAATQVETQIEAQVETQAETQAHTQDTQTDTQADTHVETQSEPQNA
ncbi:uncharacterized protein N7483_000540 [Penicillium malachiteum]|uniref:uncharacterized protein n=1 Tax=Penicillium malachiteum TaxID=1324776 RepID=UPI002548B4E4|nr:uncharacterized protein N7483_000540 [Penicillium malachiteum]KAJ5735415.1 hypothetical protein N7483_000540 [Penicillium malachiteum]